MQTRTSWGEMPRGIVRPAAAHVTGNPEAVVVAVTEKWRDRLADDAGIEGARNCDTSASAASDRESRNTCRESTGSFPMPHHPLGKTAVVSYESANSRRAVSDKPRRRLQS
jgi:hypothetical protein